MYMIFISERYFSCENCWIIVSTNSLEAYANGLNG